MKKRMLLLLLAATLLVGLLAVGAAATGDDTGYYPCYSYSDLVEALNAPDARDIAIYGERLLHAEPDDYEDFVWDHGGATTLVLKPVSAGASIWVHGDWTIPENVDVQICRRIQATGMNSEKMSNTITVNGDWYIMENSGLIHGSNTTMVFNGDLYNYVWADYTGLSEIYINGTAYLEKELIVDDVVLGPNARITKGSLAVYNHLSVPQPGAEVKSELSMSRAGNVTLSGTLKAEKITMGNANVTVAAGSEIRANYLNGGTGTFTINGTVLLTPRNNHGLGDNTTIINEGGVLEIREYSQVGYDTATGTMSGNGTLKLYATVHEVYGTYNGHPMVMGVWTNSGISEKITVANIWKNWEDAPNCEHTWATAEIIPATCDEYATTVQECTKCGTQKRVEDVAGGYSNEHDWYWSTSGKAVTQSCRRCYTYGTATLIVRNGLYTGQPVTDVASVEYNKNWTGGSVSFSYENNVEPGENTAKVTMTCNGKSVTATFSIYKDCAHNGGTVTCYARAVCDNCGKEYGTLLAHRFYGEESYDATYHYRACTNEGCTEKKGTAHAFYNNYYEWEMGIVNGTGATSHSCLECGYGSVIMDALDLTKDVITVTLPTMAKGDTVVAAVYSENGQFLGFDAATMEEDGEAELSVAYEGEADLMKVFSLMENYGVNRPAAEFDLTTQ